MWYAVIAFFLLLINAFTITVTVGGRPPQLSTPPAGIVGAGRAPWAGNTEPSWGERVFMDFPVHQMPR